MVERVLYGGGVRCGIDIDLEREKKYQIEVRTILGKQLHGKSSRTLCDHPPLRPVGPFTSKKKQCVIFGLVTRATLTQKRKACSIL